MASVEASTKTETYPSSLYAWYVVAVLILAYTVSYIDRTMLTLLVGPIRATLQISDLQLSLLHGLAFAIFYTVLGIPIGRLADRSSRRNIIIVGVVFWSLMTGLCGVAKNFGQMFLARVGVGVGEATLGPCAYSMLSDYFPPKKLTKALSIYTAAIYMGAGLALIGGGALIALVPAATLPVIGHVEPWQAIFLIIALPGFVVALMMMTVREPRRTGLSKTWDAGVAAPLSAVIAYIKRRGAAYGLLVLGFSASSLMWNGLQGWIPTFFIRLHGWTAPQVGLTYGAILLTLGIAGISCGGLLGGWLRGKGRLDSNLLVGIVSALAAAPLGALAPLMPTAELSMAVFAAFVFFASSPYGAAAAALQEITPNQMRAQVSSLYLFGLNLAGIGFGPTVVAFLTDKVFKSDMAVGSSIVCTVLMAAPLSALFLWFARKPYLKAMQERDF